MMKKFVLAAISASLVATPMIATAAEAQSQTRTVTTVKQRHNGNVVTRTTVKQQPTRYGNNRNGFQNQRKWQRGQRFDRRYATNYRVVDYRQYRGRGLYAPPRGYQWARSGNDAVLIAVASGVIGAVLGNALR